MHKRGPGNTDKPKRVVVKDEDDKKHEQK